MKNRPIHTLPAVILKRVLLLLLLTAGQQFVWADGLQKIPTKVDAVSVMLQEQVDAGKLSGAVTLAVQGSIF